MVNVDGKPHLKVFCTTLISGGLLMSACSPAPEKTEEKSRPNIVLIVADDLGTDHLGVYGHPNIPTPNLDSLASRGMLFTNAYCTSASCSASRSVILTGLFNHANGQFGHSHDYHHFKTYENVVSLPAILKKEGYTTGRIGKFHIAPDHVYPFDSVMIGNARNGVEMANRARSFIDASDGPFFLYFCTDDPHRGGGVADEIDTRPNRFGNKPPGDEYAGVKTREYSPDEVIVPDYLPDNLATREELAQYYQSVDRMDQGIGRLLQVLRESGKSENTLVIFMSDNGIAFPGAKTNLYDPAMRLPFIISFPPLIQEGSVSNAMISWVSITPTLLDILGVLPSDYSIPHTPAKDDRWWLFPPVNEKFHGTSFKAALQGQSEGFDEIFASHTFHEITMYYPMRVIQNRSYKLIWNIASGLQYPHASDLWESSTWQSLGSNKDNIFGKRIVKDYLHRAEFELYDMVNDPDEINNLAYIQENDALVNEYKNKLKLFQEATNDPWQVKWEYK
jgi:N-sulfoglucosamine sulfohydrolase